MKVLRRRCRAGSRGMERCRERRRGERADLVAALVSPVWEGDVARLEGRHPRTPGIDVDRLGNATTALAALVRDDGGAGRSHRFVRARSIRARGGDKQYETKNV